MAKKEKIVFILLLIFLPLFAQSFEINTQNFYVRFPQNWSCDQDTNLFVCTEDSKQRRKPGVIVFQFGPAGPLDSLAQFRNRLQAPRSIKGENGLPTLSRVISMQSKQINGQEWFESLHFEGELPDFYTYYIATRRGDMQYLMTLTAHKSEWQRYKPLFEQTIASIQVRNPAQQSTPAQPRAQAPTATRPTAGQPTVPANTETNFISKLKAGNKSSWILVGAAIAALLMIVYAIKI